ncbi:hypothetical protein HMPREF0766_12989 [Sphingobacterium spiritivorum ATCC 33861]|uniref:Uncharacterized protein n=1 Tax=Sphingobacterium spiritivorum ATCC 33861 TaxID=525373 RepID=D7VPR9_SPHSI|nr:hypothetical protein HMPREF0766_12989 [Sphingobacterium spiritivorum ATCC 33861]
MIRKYNKETSFPNRTIRLIKYVTKGKEEFASLETKTKNAGKPY